MACEHHGWYSEKQCGYCVSEDIMKRTLELIVGAKKIANAKYYAQIALENQQYKHKAWVIQS